MGLLLSMNQKPIIFMSENGNNFMTKKSLILIGVVLVIIVIIGFVFFSVYKPTNTTGGGTGGTNFLSTLFPFGKSSTTTPNGTPPVDVSGYTPPATTGIQKQLLTKVSSMPVAGYTVFMKERFKDVVVEPAPTPPTETPAVTTPETNSPTSTTPTNTKKTTPTKTPIPTAPATEFAPALRYVDRGTGNIYQTFADKIDERNFTTTMVPQVHDAYFGDNGNSVVMRYLQPDESTIESFVGAIPKEILGQDTSSSNEVKGSFLPENITDLSFSPDNLSIFYLFNNEDSTVGVIASSYGDKKNQTFSSSFNEWLSQWPNARMITLTTKPSYGVPGFMFSIDPSSKKMNKILSNINGLTTLTSPSGKLVLYNNNNLSLRIYNTDTKDSVSIGIKTMPEKCVWDKASVVLYCAVPNYINGTNYPDTWYQGEVSFSDQIWKVDTENGNATMLADPTAFIGGEEIDGIKLSLDEGENYLFFVNKKDSYLWELQLK